MQGQLDLLKNLAKFKSEFIEMPSYNDAMQRGLGEGYGEVESRILYTMIRYHSSKTVIEIGSGVSIIYSIIALHENSKRSNKESKMTYIEPYEYRSLKTLKDQYDIEVYVKAVQEIETRFFGKLDNNDILFIDSSHIVRIGSDVNYVFLEIIPSLRPGVIINIHDIPFPWSS